MYKTFTQNDLIRFLYNEMGSAESILIKEALLNDSDLHASYIQLKSSIDFLDTERFKLSSSDFNLAFIKSYARGFSSKPSKILKRIDMVLN